MSGMRNITPEFLKTVIQTNASDWKSILAPSASSRDIFFDEARKSTNVNLLSLPSYTSIRGVVPFSISNLIGLATTVSFNISHIGVGLKTIFIMGGLRIVQNSSQQWEIQIFDSSIKTSYIIPGTFNNGIIHNITLCIDWTSNNVSTAPIIFCYINGTAVDLTVSQGWVGNYNTAAINFYVYQKLTPTIYFYNNGVVSNFRIFNKILNNNEVKALCDTGLVAPVDRWGSVKTPPNVWMKRAGDGTVSNATTNSFDFSADAYYLYVSQSPELTPWIYATGGQTIRLKWSVTSSAHVSFEMRRAGINETIIYGAMHVNVTGGGTFETTYTVPVGETIDRFNVVITADSTFGGTFTLLKAEIVGCIADIPFDDGPRHFFDRSSNKYLFTSPLNYITSKESSTKYYNIEQCESNVDAVILSYFPSTAHYIDDYYVKNDGVTAITLNTIKSSVFSPHIYFTGPLIINPNKVYRINLNSKTLYNEQDYILSNMTYNNAGQADLIISGANPYFPVPIDGVYIYNSPSTWINTANNITIYYSSSKWCIKQTGAPTDLAFHETIYLSIENMIQSNPWGVINWRRTSDNALIKFESKKQSLFHYIKLRRRD